MQHIYFCGQCLNIFQTSKLYLAHCIKYGCNLNHTRSSHKFLCLNDKKPLKLEKISYKTFDNEIKKILYDFELTKQINFKVTIKCGYNFKKKSSRSFICGKCERGFLTKDKYA